MIPFFEDSFFHGLELPTRNHPILIYMQQCMDDYLHNWLSFYGFHVGIYTIHLTCLGSKKFISGLMRSGWSFSEFLRVHDLCFLNLKRGECRVKIVQDPSLPRSAGWTYARIPMNIRWVSMDLQTLSQSTQGK